MRNDSTCLFIQWMDNGEMQEYTMFTNGQIPRIGDMLTLSDRVGDMRVQSRDIIRGRGDDVEFVLAKETPDVGGKTRLDVVVTMAKTVTVYSHIGDDGDE